MFLLGLILIDWLAIDINRDVLKYASLCGCLSCPFAGDVFFLQHIF